MSNKIKAIKIKDQEIPLSILSEEFIKQQENGTKCESCWLWIDNIQIDIEFEKPKLLKDPSGALVSEPEEGTKVLFLTAKYLLFGDKWTGETEQINSLKSGYTFLSKDRESAEKKIQQVIKQREISHHIKILNAQEGYKFNSEEQNAYLYFDYGDEKVSVGYTEMCQGGESYMSKKTAEIILAKYTQDELKQYLGIIL